VRIESDSSLKDNANRRGCQVDRLGDAAKQKTPPENRQCLSQVHCSVELLGLSHALDVLHAKEAAAVGRTLMVKAPEDTIFRGNYLVETVMGDLFRMMGPCQTSPERVRDFPPAAAI
jgi:hypothetical protein